MGKNKTQTDLNNSDSEKLNEYWLRLASRKSCRIHIEIIPTMIIPVILKNLEMSKLISNFIGGFFISAVITNAV